MKCPNCQSENPDTAAYCTHCGARLLPEEPKKPVTQQTYNTTPNNDYFILIGIFGLILSILPIPFFHLVGLGLDIAGIALPQCNRTTKALCIVGIVLFILEALAFFAFSLYCFIVGNPVHFWFGW